MHRVVRRQCWHKAFSRFSSWHLPSLPRPRIFITVFLTVEEDRRTEEATGGGVRWKTTSPQKTSLNQYKAKYKGFFYFFLKQKRFQMCLFYHRHSHSSTPFCLAENIQQCAMGKRSTYKPSCSVTRWVMIQTRPADSHTPLFRNTRTLRSRWELQSPRCWRVD